MRTRQLQCVETPRYASGVSNTTETLEQKKLVRRFQNYIGAISTSCLYIMSD